MYKIRLSSTQLNMLDKTSNCRLKNGLKLHLLQSPSISMWTENLKSLHTGTQNLSNSVTLRPDGLVCSSVNVSWFCALILILKKRPRGNICMSSSKDKSLLFTLEIVNSFQQIYYFKFSILKHLNSFICPQWIQSCLEREIWIQFLAIKEIPDEMYIYLIASQNFLFCSWKSFPLIKDYFHGIRICNISHEQQIKFVIIILNFKFTISHGNFNLVVFSK